MILSVRDGLGREIEYCLPSRLLRLTYPRLFPWKNPFRQYHHRQRAVFIHIPKTAGRSVSEAIFSAKHGHIPAKRYLAYDPHAFDNYFTFAVVRNPWDRFISAFTSLKSAGPVDSPYGRWVTKHIHPFNDIDSFCNWIAASRFHQRRVLTWLHFRPQYKWIFSPGDRNLVDYVGRFEKLGETWQEIALRMGVEADLPKIGVRTDRSVSLSPESAEVVGEMYRRDRKLFGYG